MGEERIDLYVRTLAGLLRPGGRLLNHGSAKLMDFDTKDEGAFSERFVFPDGVPLPLSRIDLALERTGLEPTRVWRIDLRAARQGFLTGWASVYQVLAEKPV